jgi:hypothetical protein
VNPYGESKLMVEKILRWYEKAYAIRFAALRYFNAAGADPDGEIGEDHDPETHLIPLAIEAALGRGKELQVFGTDYPTPDGTAIRDYIHVTDLAEAHLLALSRLSEGASDLRLNLGTGQGHSVREVLGAVEKISGRKVPAREVGRRPGDPPALVADARKASEVLAPEVPGGRDHRPSRASLAREGQAGHARTLALKAGRGRRSVRAGKWIGAFSVLDFTSGPRKAASFARCEERDSDHTDVAIGARPCGVRVAHRSESEGGHVIVRLTKSVDFDRAPGRNEVAALAKVGRPSVENVEAVD